MIATLSALGGALLGGLLVLMGDLVSRRIEWQREGVRSLAAAATSFAVLYNKMAGRLIDDREQSLSVEELTATRSDRYAVVTGFFMTPGSEQLQGVATPVMKTYDEMVQSYPVDERWKAAKVAHFNAIVSFQSAARRIIMRGHL